VRWALLLIFGTIGLAGLAAGTRWGLEAWPVFRDNAQTQGTVVELATEMSGTASRFVRIPIVEFSLPDNVKARFKVNAGSDSAPEYEAGTTVDVLYDPRDPANARIGSFGQLWSAPLMTGGIGLVLVLLSVLLFVKIGRFEKGIKKVGPGRGARG
jgi:uncharacterized protein DUF3592